MRISSNNGPKPDSGSNSPDQNNFRDEDYLFDEYTPYEHWAPSSNLNYSKKQEKKLEKKEKNENKKTPFNFIFFFLILVFFLAFLYYFYLTLT